MHWLGGGGVVGLHSNAVPGPQGSQCHLKAGQTHPRIFYALEKHAGEWAWRIVAILVNALLNDSKFPASTRSHFPGCAVRGQCRKSTSVVSKQAFLLLSVFMYFLRMSSASYKCRWERCGPAVKWFPLQSEGDPVWFPTSLCAAQTRCFCTKSLCSVLLSSLTAALFLVTGRFSWRTNRPLSQWSVDIRPFLTGDVVGVVMGGWVHWLTASDVCCTFAQYRLLMLSRGEHDRCVRWEVRVSWVYRNGQPLLRISL